ncbi:hypothetical protein B0H16DRAFT_1470615 [Mycena metata]|uniref:Uncharacterized protein n=1 Tax=Mycena metata TaxID=1033252 RepID=A0AAD7HVI8_9AGAR|nr:hypothetical protein B0H16DRAFT_1470615 [Mycena metata]
MSQYHQRGQQPVSPFWVLWICARHSLVFWCRSVFMLAGRSGPSFGRQLLDARQIIDWNGGLYRVGFAEAYGCTGTIGRVGEVWLDLKFPRDAKNAVGNPNDSALSKIFIHITIQVQWLFKLNGQQQRWNSSHGQNAVPPLVTGSVGNGLCSNIEHDI